MKEMSMKLFLQQGIFQKKSMIFLRKLGCVTITRKDKIKLKVPETILTHECPDKHGKTS